MRTALLVFILLSATACSSDPPRMIEQAYFKCTASRSLEGGIYGKGPFMRFGPRPASCTSSAWVRISHSEFKTLATQWYGRDWSQETSFWRRSAAESSAPYRTASLPVFARLLSASGLDVITFSLSVDKSGRPAKLLELEPDVSAMRSVLESQLTDIEFWPRVDGTTCEPVADIVDIKVQRDSRSEQVEVATVFRREEVLRQHRIATRYRGPYPTQGFARPSYPPGDLRAWREGTVRILAKLTPDRRVESLFPVSAPIDGEQMVKAVAQSLASTRFSESELPVSCAAVDFTFRLAP
jgi:hypothetical protein